MNTRFFYLKDINFTISVEYATRKELLEWMDEMCKDLTSSNADMYDYSDDVYMILYKDGTTDYINEEYDGHHIKRQNIVSIVNINSCTAIVYGHFAMNENGVVEPSFEDKIDNTNIYEVDNENYTEQKQSEQEQAETGIKIPQKEGKEEPEEVAEVPGASEQEQSEPERKIIYKIDILKSLKEAGYNQGRIKREKLLNGSAVDKIRAGSTDISLKTVSAICNLLNVEPGDILAMIVLPQKRGKEKLEEVAEAPDAEEPEQSEPEQSEPEQMQIIPQKEGKREKITLEMHLEMIKEVCNKAKMHLPALKGTEKQKKYAHDLMAFAITKVQYGAESELKRLSYYVDQPDLQAEIEELAEMIEKSCTKIISGYTEYFQSVASSVEIIDIKDLLPKSEPSLERFESASQKDKMSFANHVDKKMSEIFGKSWKEKYK